MHWKRFCLVSLSLAWMAFPERARSQDAVTSTPGSSSGYATLDNMSGAMSLTPDGGSYLLFNKQTGKAVGIPNGYSRIGVRHAFFEDGPNQVFGEAHFLITDNTRYGVNTGVGYRTMIDGAVWGVNGWYDAIQSPQGFNYQQGSAGFEYLSDTFDLRANGYIPIGQRQNFLQVLDNGTTPVFVGHDFSTLGTALFQQALAGWDAEAGVPMPVINWLRMYAGVYYLTFKGDETWGVRGRMEGRITRGVDLMFQVTNDQQFGTNLNIGVDVRFDGRLPTRFGAPTNAYARRYDQVRRQWQVQLGSGKGDYAVPLINPATGEKIQVTWVNNTSGGGGDGTYEHPFNILPGSPDSDYVLVKRGVGDTVGNITLRDGQSLFGEGKQHFINTDRLGLTAIPDAFFDNSGGVPTLRAGNPAAPVVTLADNTHVSAFNILGGSTAGIAGTGIDNFLVDNVNVTSASGISVTDAGGRAIIQESTFTSTSPSGIGVTVTNTGGPLLNLAIDNVDTSGGAIGTMVRGVSSSVSLNLTNYSGTSHSNAGIILDAVAGNVGANISDATLTNVGDGLRMNVSGAGVITGNIDQLTASGSGNLLEGNVNTGTLNLDVTDANLSGSTGGSGVSLNLTNAAGVAIFDNLTADGNAVDGEQTTASGATDYRLEIHNSSLAGNVNSATNHTVLAGASLTTLVDPTDLSGSGQHAVQFRVDGASSHLTNVYADINATNSGQDAVHGTVTNGGRADVVFTIVDGSQSGHDGLNLVADSGGTISATFSDGSFAQSGNAGGHVESTNGSNVGLTFSNTPMGNNGAKGFEYLVNGGSQLSATFNDGDLSNNVTNNVVGNVAGAGSRAILTFNNTDASSQAANGGFVSNVSGGGALFSTWNDSNVAGTQNDGVRVTGTGAGTTIDLQFNNALIDNNQGNGILASLTGGNLTSSLNVDLTGSSVANNAGDGINLTVDGAGTRGVLNLTGTPVTANSRDGLEYNVTSGAKFNSTISGTGVDFSNNGENGIDGFVSGAGSNATVVIDSANVDNSGASGVLLVTQNSGQQQFALSNSSVSNSGSHGIESLTDTNGNLTLALNSVTADSNSRSGITLDALTGGDVTGTITSSSFDSNGQSAASSGVRLNVSGAGSTANLLFDGVTADGNTQNGFQLNSSTGGVLTAKINSGANGTSSASGNTSDGITLTANGAGTQANLLMFGEADVNGNGGNGLSVAGTNAQQVAVQFVGNAADNTGDGINVSLNNVNTAAIELAGSGTEISRNGGDGVEIDLTNTNLVNVTVDGTQVDALTIQDFLIANNGGAGISIAADNSDLTSGLISGNTIRENGAGGLLLSLQNGSDWNLSITENAILDNQGTGIDVTVTDGTQVLNITDNTVAGSQVDNIRVDLAGTSATELHIDRNTVDGDGIAPTATAQLVQSFLSPVNSALTSGEPPDAMGTVGLDYVVELVNDNYRVYDKTTGGLLLDISDEQFWQNAGANLGGSDTFDHRILFDIATNRWIATTITRGDGNSILLAVSDTADPTGGWQSVQWMGDTTGQAFNDFDTLGMDADSVVIATNDFGNAITVSVFSIPKADLFAATPSIARMTRIQNLNPATVGTALQAAVDFGPSDGRTAMLSTNDLLASSSQILRTDVLNGTTNAATLSATTPIAVPSYNAPNDIPLPLGGQVRSDSQRFWANTVEVNNELWAVHQVRATGSLNELRWYRIDEATNAVISTGTINLPGQSLFLPSIAVNNAGEVVISYNAASSTTAPSAYVSAGVVQGNSVVFGTPTLMTAGTGEYGGGRWGDYSATVVDPSDPSKFWSILEVGRGTTDGVVDFEYGESFNSVTVNFVPGSSLTTPGDGIHVTARDSATILSGSSINDNTVQGHGGDGIALDLSDSSSMGSFTVDGNSVNDNGGDGIRVANTGLQTIGDLSVSGNTSVTNNGGDGIHVSLTDVLGIPDIAVNSNTVQNNTGRGITVDGTNTSLDVVSVSGNTITNNLGGAGLGVNLASITGTDSVNRVLTSSNTISGNGGDGLAVHLHDFTVTTDLVANSNTVSTNAGQGILLDILNTNMNDVVASFNTVNGNTGGPGMSVLLNNTTGGPIVADQIVMNVNSITNNAGDGLNIQLNNISNVAEVTVRNTLSTDNAGAGYVLSTSGSDINAVTVANGDFSDNTNGDGVQFDLTTTAIQSLLVDANGINNNSGNGVNLDLEASSVQDLRITNNSQGSGVNIGLTFLQVGNTFPIGTGQGAWSIVNSSDPGIDITSFHFDTTPAGRIYNTETGANFPFTPFNGTDATTGLLTVNGTGVPPYPDNLVPDFTSILDLTFNDFNSGENFSWDVDMDITPGGDESVFGNDLIGSQVAVTFSGGFFLSGTMQPVAGDPSASTFIASAGNNFSGGISNNGLDGIRFNANNGSSVGHMEISGNEIDSNGATGVEMLVQDSQLPALSDHIVVSDNNITDQTGAGFRMILPDTNGNSFGIDFTGNTISGNTGGTGVDIQLNDNAGANFEANFQNNTVNNNAGPGINLALSQSIAADVQDFSGNTVSGNSGIGLSLDATDNTQFSLVMGATGHNTFSGNQDAGLAVTMNSNTQGQLTVLDSEFNGTTNGTNANFAGEGIAIHLTDNAKLPSLVIGDPVAGTSGASNNASHGVQISMDSFSQLTNPTIQHMTINENGGDGINIERRGLGVIDNFVINANSLNNNVGDGMDIAARGGNLTDEYTITNNTINGSGGRGIAFRVDSDADMTTQLNGNTISNGGGTGITVNSTINAVTDTPTFTGTWLASTITGNGGHGVDINSPNHVIQIGDASAAFPDTVISNNAQNGVLVESTGTLDIDNAQINGNGGAGVLFNGGTNGTMTIDQSEVSSNGARGIDLVMTGNTISVTNTRVASNTGDGIHVQSQAGVNNVTLNNNLVTLNTQDGLAIVNNSAAGLTAVVTNSIFSSNLERGVAIFNRGNGLANITFDDNQVFNNQLEGVYVVNTADADQNIRTAATVAMENGGLVNATPELIFGMNRNNVSANGIGSAFNATGLVVRVGTADGGSATFTDAGGFADTRAGVTATVRDNILQGNNGADVFFQSFVSTVNPLASAGTWDNTTFALGTYQTDPLARLDLIYGNNVADTTEGTTIGAAYSNDEAVFKSRTTGQTPAGPFATANRLRNAQRLADRDVGPGGTVLNPVAPVSQPSYLYPGMGASTFRVRLEPGNVFGNGSGFMLDGAPFVDITDYNGVGAIPQLWGWGTLP